VSYRLGLYNMEEWKAGLTVHSTWITSILQESVAIDSAVLSAGVEVTASERSHVGFTQTIIMTLGDLKKRDLQADMSHVTSCKANRLGRMLHVQYCSDVLRIREDHHGVAV